MKRLKAYCAECDQLWAALGKATLRQVRLERELASAKILFFGDDIAIADAQRALEQAVREWQAAHLAVHDHEKAHYLEDLLD